ncbi:MAG: endonuclease domain-containing protein [bacterium]
MRHERPTYEQAQRAREERRDPTPAEERLWQYLRGRRLESCKFLRQRPIGPYILDFFCSELALCIEVDGAVHLEPWQIQHDAMRDQWLRTRGIRILRFRNEDVLGRTGEVLAVIGRAVGRLRGVLPAYPAGAENRVERQDFAEERRSIGST